MTTRIERLVSGQTLHIIVQSGGDYSLAVVQRIGKDVLIETYEGSQLVPLVAVPSENELIKHIYAVLERVWV